MSPSCYSRSGFAHCWWFSANVLKQCLGCAAQEATLRDRFPFHEHASPAHRALVANVVAGPAVEEVERLRRIALSSIDTGTTGGVTGSHWFGTMTVKINLMKTVEDRLAADLVAAAGIIRTQADSELLAVSLLTVLLLALTALISVICVRDITRPLADLSQAMVRLAGNDLETAVPALERRDEFGDMSRALLLFKESGARYRSLIDSAPVGVVIFVHGKIVLANRAAADLFGVESAESLVGKTIAELAHPEEVETAQERLDTIVAEKISAPSAERKIVRADGGIRDVGVRSNYLRWMGEDAVQSILSDITERKQLQEQLVQYRKMEAVGRLTAGVAHDFNNVLMAIIANLEMLEDDAEGDEEHLEMIATATEAARRGAEVTARLSAFSRQQTLAPQALDLPKLCASVVALLKPSLGENIEIETRDRGLLSRAYVDPGHLQNALVNLAVNAQDAMPEGGKLRFELADVDLDSEQLSDAPEVAPGAYVMVAVQDSGTGIAGEILDKVFDPFFTTKGMANSSGLGLSMVQGFVRQSGGHIELKSEVGAGTTIRLYLPKAVATDQAKVRREAREQPPGGQLSILLVEDDAAIRGTLAKSLGRLGYQVVEAEDGPSALTFLKLQAPDLVITDLMMPGGMNGAELARQAKNQHPDLGFIFISGYADAANKVAADLDQGVRVLGKPFSQEDLAAALRDVLDEQRGG